MTDIAHDANERIILVMGVSGVGKSTIGVELAQRTGCVFLEADDDHSPANIAKMHAGIPLTDQDREPWLRAVGERVRQHKDAGECVVVACSALKDAYREKLTDITGPMTVVYLTAPAAIIAERMAKRRGHFMNPGLLRSQIETLEPPSNAITIDVSGTPEQAVQEILTRIGRAQP